MKPVIIPVQVRAVGLSDEEREMLGELLAVWRWKHSKNVLLSTYYDSHQAFKDLGISIPPSMRTVRAALGWPQKAVSALARKHVFEGFSLGGESDPFDLSEMFTRNRFDLEFPQAITAAYKHSFSLLTVTAGDVSDGEPQVMIQARDAEMSAALWDKRRRQLKAALAISDLDDAGQPSEAVMYTRDDVIRLAMKRGTWTIERLGNRTGRVLAEPLVHDPQLNRPFGRSRITREVRYLTDAAIRAMVRAEVTAEFYTAPQRYVLGAKEDAFKDTDRWKAIMGRVLALELNEEGEKPDVGTFPASSPDGQLSLYRQWGQNFCSATDLPLYTVGIFADNPSSVEAMQAAEAQLAETAEYQWRVFRPSLLRLHQDVLMVRDNLTEGDLPAESWQVNINWTPARYVSPQAAADWVVKAVSADPDLAGTTIARRRLGLSEGEIAEVESYVRRRGAGSVLQQILTGQTPRISTTTDAAPTESTP